MNDAENEKKILSAELNSLIYWTLVIIAIGMSFIIVVMIVSYITRGVCSDC